MGKSLQRLKVGYIIRFLVGITVMTAIGIALFYLYRIGKWWAWIVILLIGPAAFIYAIRQLPNEIKTMLYVLSSRTEEEFLQRNEDAARQREVGGRNAAREHYGIKDDDV